ncbi:MAG: efflux RND transporter periplasmic adaptor subunit, partial [Bacteroidetes bacterium]|nr:efflux RND transporter periplasmic adaptor subunit [Bacteroidota bacterium]
MKNLSPLLLLTLLLLNACSSSSSDLETLQAEKKALQSEIEQLKAQLLEIDASIAELDTNSVSDKLELVSVIPMNADKFQHYIEAQGKTYTENNVMVTTDMGGLVVSINATEGQFVSKGQTLMRLDNSVIVSQLAELETSLALAKDVFDKRSRLWEQNIGSEIEYLQAKNNYESLLNKKETINTQLAKTSIKAPISGYVDLINLKLGEMASPGMPAVQVVNNSQMEVRVDLPETYLGKAKVGDILQVEISALGLTSSAKISSVGQTVNAYNRSFQVIASIDNKDNKIKSNMLAKVKLSDEVVNNAITIPTRLLQEGSEGRYFVFVAEMDSTSKNY